MFLFLLLPFGGLAQIDGDQIFKTNCTACHTIGKGRLLGPDLKDVMLRRDESWVIRMIQSSQSLIGEGDTIATALFQEYNFLPMPDQPLGKDAMTALIEYLKEPKIAVAEESNQPSLLPEDMEDDKDNLFGYIFLNPFSWFILAFVIVILLVQLTLLSIVQTLNKETSSMSKEKKD